MAERIFPEGAFQEDPLNPDRIVLNIPSQAAADEQERRGTIQPLEGYQTGESRRNLVDFFTPNKGFKRDSAEKFMGGGSDNFGLGVADLALVGGVADAYDAYGYLKDMSQRNRDAEAAVRQELIDEGYGTGSMDFYRELQKRLPKKESSGEAIFDFALGGVELGLGAVAARLASRLSFKKIGDFFKQSGSNVGALPTANNAAEDMARKILELRAAGRSDEVTEAMMSAADNPYMFANTPLDMSKAARDSRADEMFPRKGFHGTNADIDTFQGNVFSTDNPTLASTYARGSADAQIYPLRLGSKLGDTVVEGGGANWSQLNISDVKDPAVADWLDWAEGQKISTREIEQAASREGRSGVQFKDIYDTGPGFNSGQFKNLGYTKEQERDLQRQYMKDLSEPSNVDVRLSPNLVRSEFARFDPEFRNLRNLSASILSAIGFTGLAASFKDEERGGGI